MLSGRKSSDEIIEANKMGRTGALSVLSALRPHPAYVVSRKKVSTVGTPTGDENTDFVGEIFCKVKCQDKRRMG